MRPLVLILCLLLPACGNLQNLANKARTKRQQKQLNKLAEAATNEVSNRIGERAVGEVVYVDGDNGYALVRARNGVSLPVSEELECRGNGNGRLKVTPERKNTFYAADILSGTPQKGDPVIAVKSKTKQGPKLVPVVASAPPGSTAPANTVNLDPASIRPEDLPRTNLDEPGAAPPKPASAPVRTQSGDPGNLLLPPPDLPQ
jgi:hypothetical protein